MESARLHDTFEYEEWVESVAGETLRVTAWDGTAAECDEPAAARPTYCGECDEDVMLLLDEVVGRETVGHCPMCGSLPGLHEMEGSGRRVADEA